MGKLKEPRCKLDGQMLRRGNLAFHMGCVIIRYKVASSEKV